jgi:hypothetical protein
MDVSYVESSSFTPFGDLKATVTAFAGKWEEKREEGVGSVSR